MPYINYQGKPRRNRDFTETSYEVYFKDSRAISIIHNLIGHPLDVAVLTEKFGAGGYGINGFGVGGFGKHGVENFCLGKDLRAKICYYSNRSFRVILPEISTGVIVYWM